MAVIKGASPMTMLVKLLSLFVLLGAMSASAQAAEPRWLKKFNTNYYKGKVVYLDFWASWCGPCRQSFPWLNDMQAKYKKQGLIVIGINLDEEPEMAQEFLKSVPAKFRLFADPSGKLAQKYDVMGMPSSVMIDGRGKIRGSHVGFKKGKAASYEKSIVKLLNEL